MNAAVGSSFGNNAWLVARGVCLEYVRRREFAVTLLFMGLFLVTALLVRFVGVENDATAAFVLNLGINLSFFFGAAIALMTASRQFPAELETRTLYPLLAKPLTRTSYFWGKWMAACLTGWATYILLMIMACLPSLRPIDLNAGMFAQMLVLHLISISLVAAMALWLSLLFPVMTTAVIVVLTVLGAGKAVQLIQASASDANRAAVKWVTSYIPDFNRLDIVNFYTDGSAMMPIGDFGMRIVYALILTLFFQVAGVWVLEKKSL